MDTFLLCLVLFTVIVLIEQLAKGNIAIINGDLDEDLYAVVLIADIIVFLIIIFAVAYKFRKQIKTLIKKADLEISSSFRYARSRLKNLGKDRKEKKILSRNTASYKVLITRLKELGNLSINGANVIRVKHLCVLLDEVSNNNQFKECENAVVEKEKLLAEIEDIEYKLILFAKQYISIGDTQKCTYLLEIVNDRNNQNKISELEEVKKQIDIRNKEKRELKKWIASISIVLILIAIIITKALV